MNTQYTLTSVGIAVKTNDRFQNVQDLILLLESFQDDDSAYMDKLMAIAKSTDGVKYSHIRLTFDKELQCRMDRDEKDDPDLSFRGFISGFNIVHKRVRSWPGQLDWHSLYVPDSCMETALAHVTDIMPEWMDHLVFHERQQVSLSTEYDEWTEHRDRVRASDAQDRLQESPTTVDDKDIDMHKALTDYDMFMLNSLKQDFLVLEQDDFEHYM
jgi:hypothetical protein